MTRTLQFLQKKLGVRGGEDAILCSATKNGEEKEQRAVPFEPRIHLRCAVQGANGTEAYRKTNAQRA